MSICAPTAPTGPYVIDVPATVAAAVQRIEREGSVVSCSGLGSDIEAALYVYLRSRKPEALAAVYAAADARP